MINKNCNWQANTSEIDFKNDVEEEQAQIY